MGFVSVVGDSGSLISRSRSACVSDVVAGMVAETGDLSEFLVAGTDEEGWAGDDELAMSVRGHPLVVGVRGGLEGEMDECLMSNVCSFCIPISSSWCVARLKRFQEPGSST